MIVTHGKGRVLECATFDFGEKMGELLMCGQSGLPRYSSYFRAYYQTMKFFRSGGLPLDQNGGNHYCFSLFPKKHLW